MAGIVGLRVSVSEKPQATQGTKANIQSQNLGFILLLNVPWIVFFTLKKRAINMQLRLKRNLNPIIV